VGVVTRKSSKFNSDFCSLESLAKKNGVPCISVAGNKQRELATWLQDQHPDAIYCFGWSYLLGPEILNIAPLGVIGYHPAFLPQNRGRHPIVWALALGLSKTASTFLFMDETADGGDILSQVEVSISNEDDAGTLYKKLTETALEQIGNFTEALCANTYKRIPQDPSRANSWRKRGLADGQIDWRMSAKSIYNLVRALTRPYVGAHCLYHGRAVKIWQARMISALSGEVENLEPGKILRTGTSTIVIKCGEGVLELLEHEFSELPQEGSYL
jgi:methionyl-tRNA formyltransferase